jgi:hypothetical protein
MRSEVTNRPEQALHKQRLELVQECLRDMIRETAGPEEADLLGVALDAVNYVAAHFGKTTRPALAHT